ncbi:pirk [Drosophila busckii]|uniref:Pirk n=1 Tax=Drosophila busckii TaxID=30019 RepID=A0A0M5JA01_DROBS|nr:uncharacterized protein LOC108595583 [Drosophila busckii]ALC41356.1 pirk [Drosophila busckii]
MGVRVIETDSASDSYDDEECSTCNSSHKNKTSHAKRTANTAGSDASSFTLSSRDLVGNCKEYRIENNTRDLRIIGNGNRVRIVNNSGKLQLIGNQNRLKIQQNSGHIKYTGNDGRIYIGSESSQQTVDYIGCNGTLKVVKSLLLQNHKTSKPTKSGKNSTNATPTAKSTVEIGNKLTIVNGIAGNIVIKNAINVSI